MSKYIDEQERGKRAVHYRPRLRQPSIIYQCGHCGFIGHCYGIATGVGITAPYCPKCEKNNKLTEVVVEFVPTLGTKIEDDVMTKGSG